MKQIKKYPIISLILLFFIIKSIFCAEYYDKDIGQTCSSNLECHSACCSSKECSDTDKCESLIWKIYVCEAALCLLFIIIFTIYLVCKLKHIREEFQNVNNQGVDAPQPKNN